uniref:Uncharacterized protein n=2 Tax=Moniliophthora roreri TaxID=221103 RepID=A0A0W0F7C5_MONRR
MLLLSLTMQSLK